MGLKTLFIASLLLAALHATAQDHSTPGTGAFPFAHLYWASAADSADFTAFRASISMVEEQLENTSGDYRAVWRVGEHGGLAAVSRGDSSLLHIDRPSLLGLFMHLPFRMSDGRRGVMVVHETPCGLICRDTVYYLEE
ncbi:MAG: hypothetical protein JNJ91_05460 [Flavobacteriales bacterium]|nr:hypothetical protein [Flavobacteriales bacterium]